MGWVEVRLNDDGEDRFIARYRDARGHKQVAGTFATEEAAVTAWQKAEILESAGRLGDPAADGRPSSGTSRRSGCPTMSWKRVPGKGTRTRSTGTSCPGSAA